MVAIPASLVGGNCTTRVYCFGFRFWKHAHVQPFFGDHVTPVFVDSLDEALRRGLGTGDTIAVWGQREGSDVARFAASAGLRVLRVEDGFLRSVGLGADFVPPMSLVLDSRGIYFDPSTESDLDVILNETEFSDELLQRARAIRARICNGRLTKYNVECDAPLNIDAGRKKIILVPGQVEDDASIRKGTSSVRNNLDLLKVVREKNPDAFVIFKPHPDVLARNRRGKVVMSQLKTMCDHVESRSSVIRCIEAADEVHTMTSLAGFDALLRGRRVVTYGMPFYAGWGLTEDTQKVAHRRRRLSLDALVAGVLILYPRYFDPCRRQLVECEDVIVRLLEQRKTIGRTYCNFGTRRAARKLLALTGALSSSLRMKVIHCVKGSRR